MATVVGGARRLLCMPSPVIKWRNVYPVQLRALSTSPTLASSKIRPFDYTHAVVRKIPSSFADNYQKINAHKVKRGIQLARATEQLTKYIAILKICGVDVITLSAEEKYPDCVFVEDCAVIIGNKACITRPGHPSRRGEVEEIRKGLETLGLEICEMDNTDAYLEGGDFLYTGQEILVGQSTRSNEAAVSSLQKVFPDIPVLGIPVSGTLHLKSVITVAEEGVLVTSKTTAAQQILKYIQSRGKGQYRFIQVENDKSANILFVNGCVVMKPAKEIGASDFQILTSALSVPWIATDFDEFYEADGCLTCCSLLINKMSSNKTR